MSTTLLSLDEKLLKSIGDWIQHLVTTAIAASTSVVSTHLTNYRTGTPGADYFNDRWIYFDDEANIGVCRLVSDDDGTNTLTVLGGNLLTDVAEIATFRLSRYSWANRKLAINEAIEEIYPNIFRHIESRELITGNILPNSHFEDWAATTAPDLYTMQDANITATALATAGLVRGEAKSMNAVTGAGGAGKYVYITSKTYPRLLDLMGRTITFKCWAYPEDANDASIQIYTIKADGTTTQTLTSTTSCPATAWTLLELENQAINDDIVEIQFRFKITTASKYVYFDAARVTGRGYQYEHLLPTGFANGAVAQVYVQSSGDSDDICDDLHPRYWDELYGHEIVERAVNGTMYKYIKLPALYSDLRQIRLVGYTPLEDLSADTDGSTTITLDDERHLGLLIAYAKYKLYQMTALPASSKNIDRYERELAKAYAEYMRLLPSHKMIKPKTKLNIAGV